MKRSVPASTMHRYARRWRALVVLLHLALCWNVMFGTGTAEAQTEPAWQSRLAPFINGLVTTNLDQSAVAGALVTVVTSDRVLLSRGYRIADARSDRKIDPSADIIPIASISKVFTAFAILQLVEEGRVALEDSVARHLPGLDLAQPFGEITIADLLAHAGGLEDRYSNYFADPAGVADTPAIERISEVLPRQIRPPSDVISYSNAGYVLLGEIVARVSGGSYEDYLTRTILAPMGLDRAVFMQPDRMTGVAPNRSLVWSSGRYIGIDHTPFPAIHNASGGLATTARNMGRVLQMLLQRGQLDGRTIFSEDLVTRMQAPVYPGRAEFAGRTLGYWTETWGGHQVYYHGGTHFGFHTMMVLAPSLDLAFFVAANSPSGSALMGLPRRVLREVILPGISVPSAPTGCSVTCLEAYAGDFITTRRNETGIDRLRAPIAPVIGIRTTDDGMLLMSGLDFSRRFQAIGEDLFETPEADTRLGFRRDGTGDVTLAYLDGGIHSFDRQGFWLTYDSLWSGARTALIGIALCVVSILLIRRSQRRWAATPLLLAIIWAVALGANYAGFDHIAFAASPGVLLWVLTGLLYAAAVTTVMAAVRLLVDGRKAPVGRYATGMIAVAIASFTWTLFVAWNWNLLTAAHDL